MSDAQVPLDSHRKFPPPNAATVARITNLLYTRPEFYIKVMALVETLQLPMSDSDAQACETNTNAQITCESDEDISPVDGWTATDNLPTNSRKCTRKRMSSYLNFAPNTSQPEDQFGGKRRRFKIRLLGDSRSLCSVEGCCGSFGQFEPEKRPDGRVPYLEPQFDFATAMSLEEIRANRLSEKEMTKSKLFSKYEPGEPSSRLYVKNVSKKCRESQLKRLFATFVDVDDEEMVKAFDVRLMTNGKMRGQAFVSMGSVESAKRALRQCNGFVFDDKPIVVLFARSALSNE